MCREIVQRLGVSLIALFILGIAVPVSAATIVTFITTGSGDTISVTNPQLAAVTGRIRLIPDAGPASVPALPFSLANLETRSFPNVLANFGAPSAPAILAVETSDVVKVSSASLRVGFPDRHLTLPVRFNPGTPAIGSLTLGILNGLVRVNIYEHQGSVTPLVSRTLASSGEEVTRLRYADLLPASMMISDGYAELIPPSGQVVGTAVNPPTRRRAVAPPSTPPPTLSIAGSPACEFATGIRASVTAVSGSTYRWSLMNATAQGSVAGNTLDLVLGSRGYASVVLERTLGGSLSTVEAVIAIAGKPGYEGSTASSVTLGEDATITWTLSGAAPTSQTLSGTDFGAVTLDPAATSYAYRPTTTGSKTYTLTADNDCGSGSARGDYTVSDACTTPRIDSFTNSGAVCAGNAVQLMWATSGSGSVTINNGVGAVPANGSISVSPPSTTPYMLTKTAACGTANATTVATVTTPSASSFTIDFNPIAFGCGVPVHFTIADTATWTVASAGHNSLTPNSGTGSGSFTAIYGTDNSDDSTDVLTLSLTDACGNTATRTLNVAVSTPSITSFATPASVASGASGTITFTYSTATHYTLTSSLGNSIVPATGNSTSGGSATYTRDKASGPDTLTLHIAFEGCDTATQTRVIN